jgi:hypothetical protein
VDGTTFWRSGLIQAAAVTVLSLALGLALPHSFFEDWGWIAGPASWLLCAAVTARVLDLPTDRVLLAAVVAGIPSAIAVLAGVHWLGVVIAIGVFAALCAHAAGRAGGHGQPTIAGSSG